MYEDGAVVVTVSRTWKALLELGSPKEHGGGRFGCHRNPNLSYDQKLDPSELPYLLGGYYFLTVLWGFNEMCKLHISIGPQMFIFIVFYSRVLFSVFTAA